METNPDNAENQNNSALPVQGSEVVPDVNGVTGQEKAQTENGNEKQAPFQDPALLAREFERKYYKEYLRMLLKSRCCSPSDLEDLQQLRCV
jgi:hypothetical protein